MFLNSIRWRLQLWHGVLLLVVLAGFGLTAYQLQRATRLQRIDDELQQRMSVAGNLARRPNEGPGRPPFERFGPPNRREELPPVTRPESMRLSPPERPKAAGQPPFAEGLPPFQRDARLSPQALRLFEGTGSNSYYYIVWARDGTILSKSDSAPLGVPRPGVAGIRNKNIPRGPAPNKIQVRGTHREMYHYTPPGECILAGIDISLEIAELRRFAGLLLGVGSGVLVLGLAGGWWLSSRTIRPIKTISATAARIANGDLSQRIPIQDSENELDQLASVLNSTFARLDAAFAQQAQFTSDAAHELRTPVSVILTQTQSILARPRSGAEYCETLEACQRAAQRMRQLIESLLELARLDAGQAFKKERVDLANILAECIELLRPLADERKISIESVIHSASCMGDADRLKQVFTNLLSNAIHYNKEGGSIRVSVEHQSDRGAIITITDSGVGLSPENIPHLFERFWRADQSRTHSEGRSGLGLSIVKSIVDMHRGEIQVVSKPDQGSTFIVRLP
jgi:two-component system, OmpR family, sensor kinase